MTGIVSGPMIPFGEKRVLEPFSSVNTGSVFQGIFGRAMLYESVHRHPLGKTVGASSGTGTELHSSLGTGTELLEFGACPRISSLKRAIRMPEKPCLEFV